MALQAGDGLAQLFGCRCPCEGNTTSGIRWQEIGQTAEQREAQPFGDHLEMVKRVVDSQIDGKARTAREGQVCASIHQDLAVRFQAEPKRAIAPDRQLGRSGGSVRNGELAMKRKPKTVLWRQFEDKAGIIGGLIEDGKPSSLQAEPGAANSAFFDDPALPDDHELAEQIHLQPDLRIAAKKRDDGIKIHRAQPESPCEGGALQSGAGGHSILHRVQKRLGKL